MLKKLLVAAFSLALLLSQPAAALEPGDIVMTVEPSEQDLTLYPGKTLSSRIEVTNDGRKPFDIKVSSVPFHISNTDYDPDFSTQKTFTMLSKWITLPTTEFHLSPGETVAVPFKISVPANALGGGQYAAIMITTSDSASESSTMKVNSRIASLLYARVEDGTVHEAGELVTQSIPSFILGDNFSISATIANTGNVSFRATQTVSIRDFFSGQEVVSPTSVSPTGTPSGTATFSIFPEMTRATTLKWEQAPKLGLFRVKQTVTFLGQEHAFENVVLICPLWLPIILAVFVILVIIWLILRLLKHRKIKQI